VKLPSFLARLFRGKPRQAPPAPPPEPMHWVPRILPAHRAGEARVAFCGAVDPPRRTNDLRSLFVVEHPCPGCKTGGRSAWVGQIVGSR